MSSTEVSRRGFLGAVGIAGAGLAVPMIAPGLPAVAVDGVAVVSGGQPQVVVVPRELSPGTSPQPQLDHTVEVLVEQVRQATGVDLPVRLQIELDNGGAAGLPAGRLYVGWVGPGSTVGSGDLAGLDVDGFVIAAEGSVVTIIGPSDWGTRFGVYEFLERHVGVRWLMPGPSGTDVPAITGLTVPYGKQVESPDFKGRSFSPLFLAFTPAGLRPDAPIWTTTDPQVQWAAFNRSRQRGFSGGLNLYNIFPPSLYADPALPTYHPEYYPIINGVTKLPGLYVRSHWQPRFDIQATVDVAVAYVLQYFTDNPGLDSVSLTVNDGEGYSETDVDPNVYNSVGFPAASEAYFTWVNQVIDGVLAARPDHADKRFIVLAYYCTADAPSFNLRPQALPLLARDSIMWSDPALRLQLQTQFTAWSARASDATWYDYPSGSRYLAPRLNIHHMAEAYRWANQNGVNHQYADMYPDLIGEGPKTWVHNKLLWDVDADVDELIDEWCGRVAGPLGGPHLREFFDFWETFWTTTEQQTAHWAYGGARTYLEFNLCGYLDEVQPADAAQCRTHLTSARALAQTAAQQARVDLISARFGYVEASVTSYPRPVARPAGEPQALAIADDIAAQLDLRVAAAIERRSIAAQLKSDPVTDGRYNHDIFHYWTGYNGNAFFRLVDHLVEHGAAAIQVRDRLGQIGASTATPCAARFARMVLEVADGTRTSIVPNDSFEAGGLEATPWDLRGNVERMTGIGRNGTAGLRSWSTPGVPRQRVQHDIIQRVPITAGLAVARIWFRLGAPETVPGVMSVKFDWQTSDNKMLQRCTQATSLLSEGQAGWSWVAMMEDVPDGVVTVDSTGQEVTRDVDKLLLWASVLAYNGAAEVHCDDFEVFSEGA